MQASTCAGSTDTLSSMQDLRAATKGILARVEEKTGKSIQFMRDEQLKVLATLQMARNGAGFHVLRYSPSNEPLDYLIAYQAGYVLRLFENQPSERFDFAPKPDAGKEVATLVGPTLSMSAADREVLPQDVYKRQPGPSGQPVHGRALHRPGPRPRRASAPCQGSIGPWPRTAPRSSHPRPAGQRTVHARPAGPKGGSALSAWPS